MRFCKWCLKQLFQQFYGDPYGMSRCFYMCCHAPNRNAPGCKVHPRHDNFLTPPWLASPTPTVKILLRSALFTSAKTLQITRKIRKPILRIASNFIPFKILNYSDVSPVKFSHVDFTPAPVIRECPNHSHRQFVFSCISVTFHHFKKALEG